MFSLVPMNRREMGLFGQMSELLNDPFFKNFGRSDQSFMVDIEDKGDSYVLEAELPGMSKDEIDSKRGVIDVWQPSDLRA